MFYIVSSVVVLDTSDCHSLKEKRSVLRSLVQKIKNKFNMSISVSEVDSQNNAQEIVLGIVTSASDAQAGNRMMTQIMNFIEEADPGRLVDYDLVITER